MREVKLTESQLETTRAFVARLGATLGIVLYTATIPFLTFFMLKDREKFGRVLAGMLMRSERLGESDVDGRDLPDDDSLRAGPLVRRADHGLRHHARPDGPSHRLLLRARTDRRDRHPPSLRRHHHVHGPGRGRRVLPVRRREGAARVPRLQPAAVSRGQRADAVHRGREGQAVPAHGHDRVRLLGHDLGSPGRGPRRPADVGDQGRLRARPGLGRDGAPPRRARPAPLPQETPRRRKPPKRDRSLSERASPEAPSVARFGSRSANLLPPFGRETIRAASRCEEASRSMLFPRVRANTG